MAALIDAQMGFATPRGSPGAGLLQTPPSSKKKVPPVFKGRSVPWTPRGQDLVTATLPLKTVGMPAGVGESAQDRGGDTPQTGVLHDMVGAGSPHVAAQRGCDSEPGSSGGSEQRTSSDSTDVLLREPDAGCHEMDSAPAQDIDGALLQWSGASAAQQASEQLREEPLQWTPQASEQLREKPLQWTAQPEIEEVAAESPVRSADADVSWHGSADGSETGASMVGSLLEINGVQLDGQTGIPQDVRSNLGAFVRYMKKSQGQPEVQAQCCVFLYNYASFRSTSRIKAAKAGAVDALLELLVRTKDRHPHQALLAELACWVLNVLCVEGSIAAEAVHAGAVKLVSLSSSPLDAGFAES
eukprot:Tamp_08870.p1 GENE.Tamp_08870~~Tamp_08870.p1  ORF type:complete len:393 (-),score=78.88 Tamp_08870:1084-2151(-)